MFAPWYVYAVVIFVQILVCVLAVMLGRYCDRRLNEDDPLPTIDPSLLPKEN